MTEVRVIHTIFALFFVLRCCFARNLVTGVSKVVTKAVKGVNNLGYYGSKGVFWGSKGVGKPPY